MAKLLNGLKLKEHLSFRRDLTFVSFLLTNCSSGRSISIIMRTSHLFVAFFSAEFSSAMEIAFGGLGDRVGLAGKCP